MEVKEEEIDTVKVNEYLEVFEKWQDHIIKNLKVFNKYSAPVVIYYYDDIKNAYNFARDILKNCPPLTQEEIQELVSSLELYDKVYSGIFISSVINNRCPRSKIKMKVNYSLDYLAMNTEKDWTINGDVGDCVGAGMNGGKIIIEGNTGDWLGKGMKGGEIRVKGNVGDWLGKGKEGGKIIVEGDAGEAVGELMRGGEIHLDGDYGFISINIYRGEIYRKGRLINKDNKWVGWYGYYEYIRKFL